MFYEEKSYLAFVKSVKTWGIDISCSMVSFLSTAGHPAATVLPARAALIHTHHPLARLIVKHLELRRKYRCKRGNFNENIREYSNFCASLFCPSTNQIKRKSRLSLLHQLHTTICLVLCAQGKHVQILTLFSS